MTSPTTQSFDTHGGQPSPEIASFVSAVRAWLDDLSTDEVTELTGGLEADLTDALAEAGSTPSELYGDPKEYASELRAAAGLPPRDAGGVQRAAGPGLIGQLDEFFVDPAREAYRGALRNLEAKPWWPGVREFLIVLRPAWWVIRAWVVVQILFIIAGNPPGGAVRGGFGGLVLLLGLIVLSVQAGRGTPMPSPGLRKGIAAWNVTAVVFLLPVMFSTGGSATYYGGDVSYEPPPGLSVDGEPVTNIFPYDSEGRPLIGVQLYDQDGRPLETDEGSRMWYDENGASEVRMVPGSPAGLAPRWNAFPLQQRRVDLETSQLGPVQPAPQPLTGVPPGASPTLAPTVTPSPSLPTSQAPVAPKSEAPAASASRAPAAPTVTPTATR